MIEWNYISQTDKSSGYESVIDTLKQYTNERYVNASDEEKEALIDEVFNIYRSINIFPITYYNSNGIVEEIQRCAHKQVDWDGTSLDLKLTQGSSVCRFLFPNLYDVECRGRKNNSPYYKFYDDHKLKRAIKFCFDHKPQDFPVVPAAMKSALEMIDGNVATNFPPMKAKAIYEKFCPVGGNIYDFSCGFGGRMLGALSSMNNYKYFGVEPCSETYDNLNNLGRWIEKTMMRENTFQILKCGSETLTVNEPFIDFAFSSPPYFNLEVYSSEETQCYNKYPTLESWFEGYVYPTIRNIYDILKPSRYYAVNIADFKMGSKNVQYVDRWIEASIECGFEYVGMIPMKLQTRRGDGHCDNSERKEEGIYLFKKNGEPI